MIVHVQVHGHVHGRVAGKVVLIAGAGSGIGRATAVLLAGEGAEVVCTDVDEDAAAATADLAGGAAGRARTRRLDVTSEADWRSAMEEIAAGPALDVVVNSAGIASGATLVETPLTEWRRVMAVNLDGVFLGTRFAIEAFRRSGTPGCIVNVASVSGLAPHAGAGAYSASKAGVCMLSEVAAKECREKGDGIRVNVVSPGGVRTPLWRSMGYFRRLVTERGSEDRAFEELARASGVERFAEPQEVAHAILYLASDEARYVTGANLVIDGGYRL